MVRPKHIHRPRREDGVDARPERCVVPVHVRRWLDAHRSATYVLTGNVPPETDAVLKRLEAAPVADARRLPAAERELLERTFGPAYARHLALEGRRPAKYVNIALFSDDSVRTARIKLAAALEAATGGQQRVPANELYVWARRPHIPSAYAAELFVSDVFHGRVTCPRPELFAALDRVRRGSARPLSAYGPHVHVTLAHAKRLVEERGGIDHVTAPLGHELRFVATGYRVFFDVVPYAKESAKEGTTFPPYVVDRREEDALLGDAWAFADAPLDCTTKGDFVRNARAQGRARHGTDAGVTGEAWERAVQAYFPDRPALSRLTAAPSAEEGAGDAAEDDQHHDHDHDHQDEDVLKRQVIAEERSVCAYRGRSTTDDDDDATDGVEPRLILVHLRTATTEFDNVASASLNADKDVIELDEVFRSSTTTPAVPLLRFFDGNIHRFKVNRMALHKQEVDPAWVATHFARFGKSHRERPALRFVVATHYDDDNERIYSRASLTAQGVLDLVCPFSADRPGDIAVLRAVLRDVNAHVIHPVNRVLKNAATSTAFHDLDPGALAVVDPAAAEKSRAAYASPTRVVNMVFHATISAPGKRSVDGVAAELARGAHAYFGLVTRLPREQGSGVSAYYRRTRDTAASASPVMRWLVALEVLTRSYGLSDADAAAEMARLFAVPFPESLALVRSIRGGEFREEQQRLIMRHYYAQVPMLTLVPMHDGKTFKVRTALVADAAHVRRAVSAAQCALRKAAANAHAHAHAHAAQPIPRLNSAPAPAPPNSEGAVADDDADEEAAARADDGIDDLAPGAAAAAGDVLADHLDDLLSEETRAFSSSTTAADASRTSNNDAATSATTAAADAPAPGGDDPTAYESDAVLHSLYRADPELFHNRSAKHAKYPSVCGAVNKRQPVVVSADELRRLDPRSHTGAIRYGSTPELAERNAYICPKVWCPESRVSMSAAQYAARGHTCPRGSEGERAIVFEAPYWNGKDRMPGLLSSSKHPTGLCMPCCFINMRAKCDSTTPGSTLLETPADGGRRAPSQTTRQGDAPRDSGGDVAGKYIKSDALPLEAGRLGTLPSSLVFAFHGTERVACGSREDGSGQITSRTSCYVRRGTARHRQSFLQCMLEVLRPPGVATVEDLVTRIVTRLTPDTFVSISDGVLCRIFMDQVQVMAPKQQLASEKTHAGGTSSFGDFVQWFLSRDADAYRAKMHVQYLVPFLRTWQTAAKAAKLPAAVEAREGTDTTRRGQAFDALRACHERPDVRREFLVFRSLQRFKAYLADAGIVKEHKLLGGLFNAPLPWLNPQGTNVIVFEPVAEAYGDTDAAVHHADMLVDCESLRHNNARQRLSAPFAFVIKQERFYEPVVNVHATANRVIKRELFHYDANPHVRALVNAVAGACRSGAADNTPGSRLCSSAACVARFLRRVLGERLHAQVINFSFRLVGFLTDARVYVPLPEPEAVLVGATAPRTMMYVTDVARCRPYAGRPLGETIDKAQRLFARLASTTADARMGVARVETRGQNEAFLVLYSGHVVPLAPASADRLREVFGTYLVNQNILVGHKLADARVRYVEAVRGRALDVLRHYRAFVKRLEENTDLLREFAFLRSAFNPFPLWFRRERMYALVHALLRAGSGGEQHPPTLTDEGVHALADALLSGPDPLFLVRHPRLFTSVNTRPIASVRPQGAVSGADVYLTDADVASGRWVQVLARVVVNPLASDRSARHASAREGNADASVHAYADGIRALAQEARGSLLRSFPSAAASSSSSSHKAVSTPPYALMSTSRIARFSSDTSRAAAASNRARRVFQMERACDVWQVFHVASLLVQPSGEAVPVGAFRAVMRESLIADAKGNHGERTPPPEIHAMLSSHPTFARVYWGALARVSPRFATQAAAAKKRARRQPPPKSEAEAEAKSKQTPASRSATGNLLALALTPETVDAMTAAMETPAYRPGAYDVRALAYFLDLVCEVLDPTGKTAQVFNVGSKTAAHGLVLVHEKPDLFHVVTHDKAILFARPHEQQAHS